MTLTGLAGPFVDGVMHFADDLRTNIAAGDANYLSMLDEADAYVARNGLDLPEEPRPVSSCPIQHASPIRCANSTSQQRASPR